MRIYHQLTQAQRYQIYALRKTKHTLAEIAKMIGVNKSSVSRELKRNRGKRGYRPQQAHEIALERRVKAVPRITTKGMGSGRETAQARLEPRANLWQAQKGTGHSPQSRMDLPLCSFR